MRNKRKNRKKIITDMGKKNKREQQRKIEDKASRKENNEQRKCDREIKQTKNKRNTSEKILREK